MKKIMKAVLIVLALIVGLALVGCGASNTTQNPLEAKGGQPVNPILTDDEALELAMSVCGILDEAGVHDGLQIMFDIGAESGVDPNVTADVILISVQVVCPEYEDDLVARSGA